MLYLVELYEKMKKDRPDLDWNTYLEILADLKSEGLVDVQLPRKPVYKYSMMGGSNV